MTNFILLNQHKFYSKFLDHFCLLGKKDVANLLIAKGADVSAEDSYGKTPLISAIESGMITTIDKLIKNGADGKLSAGWYTKIRCFYDW